MALTAPSSSPTWLKTATSHVSRFLTNGQFDTPEALRLHRLDEEQVLRSGSKPLFLLRDEVGAKYVFKLADPDLLAAEVAAYELRRLGGKPCVPARLTSVELDDLGKVQGLVKPFIEFDPEQELPADTRSWSELQRSVILLEHAWEWFLDNLDTNTGQYALIGPEAYPINMDWDRAFATAGRSELSRFAKYKRTLPNARTFLYADYVEGRIDLNFGLLGAEASCIAALPEQQVVEILRDYAWTRYGEADEVDAFVDRVTARQRDIQREVQRFVLALKQERKELRRAGRAGIQGRLLAAKKLAWNHWQLSLNTIVQGPAGKLGRALLKRARARALGVPHLRQRSQPG